MCRDVALFPHRLGRFLDGRRHKFFPGRLVLLAVLSFMCAFTVVFLIVYPFVLHSTQLPFPDYMYSVEEDPPPPPPPVDVEYDGRHRLAVLVPYRDRLEQLTSFVQYMSLFLTRQLGSPRAFRIFVVSQADRLRFNRGALLNVGFLYATHRFANDSFDYLALHDVDLLPHNLQLSYRYPAANPVHLSAPQYHPIYHYPRFLGGVLLLTARHFVSVNGFSNKFWGWGLEDDDLRLRFDSAGIEVIAPNLTSGPHDTFLHLQSERQSPRDHTRADADDAIRRRRDRTFGFRDVAFREVRVTSLAFNGHPVTLIEVVLHCNVSLTPYCLPHSYS